MYATRWSLRLCRKDVNFYSKCNHIRAVTSAESIKNDKTKRDFDRKYEILKGKIIFNSHLESEKLQLGYYKYHLKTLKKAEREKIIDRKNRSLQPLPISLQYFVDKDRLLEDDQKDTVQEEPVELFQLPFANSTTVSLTESKAKTADSPGDNTHSNIDKWMTAYEHFDDSRLETEEDSPDCGWSNRYGTPDPNAGISRVPCGGCGVLLHCTDPAIPGYLPSEIFKGRTREELLSMECQRCHFLKEYNIALDVSVQPEEYEKLLWSIRHVKSLVVMMVDLLDFPCSIWPGIVDIIGTERPLFIVGNKVDLLPGDSIGYIKRIKESLLSEIKKTKLSEANIKYVSLISAKTGYGVEDLISMMFKLWLCKGDVFLIGCTNVGKSSLFNALLQSDYCKVHAVDIVMRATVSQWPGTTLNLLKFPINRPSGWKIYQRTQRLESDAKLLRYEREIRKNQIDGKSFSAMPSLMGHIGRTFSDPREFSDIFSQVTPERLNRAMGLNENDKIFAQSKWFYDTPGVIHPDEVLSMLTAEELLMAIPKNTIRPQTYYLLKGSTIFIGGLSRIDFLDCTEPCRFTIFCSDALPITIVKTEDADRVYEGLLGTELLGAPVGGVERLTNWPGLGKHSEVLEFTGEGPKLCCGDVVLSSVAWVSVTAKKDSVCKVSAWTPLAKGVHVRKPSMLKYSINMKGKRIRDTPAYMIGKVYVDDEGS